MILEERLILENQILSREGFSQFQIYTGQTAGNYNLWGEQRSSSGNLYKIWSPIPLGYPYSKPPVYVYEPNPLWAYGGYQTINSFGKNGTSHRMHTLTNGPNDEVQICHWHPDRWHSGITFNRVILKVILWLEAYEQHRATGKDICDFVRTMAQT